MIPHRHSSRLVSPKLRWRISRCRCDRTHASAAFSENNSGKTSNGNGVVQASEAASSAARRRQDKVAESDLALAVSRNNRCFNSSSAAMTLV